MDALVLILGVLAAVAIAFAIIIIVCTVLYIVGVSVYYAAIKTIEWFSDH